MAGQGSGVESIRKSEIIKTAVMAEKRKLRGFAKYAWFALAFNVLVILWGVFLRASRSGDGCGQFWLTCNGELIPSAPELKTVIEFSHRISTAVDGLIMLILLIWAVVAFARVRTRHRKLLLYLSGASVFFVITEALVGAGLVLTGNTAETLTAERPFWAMGHLINTFILLTFLSLTAWFASTGRSPRWVRSELKATLLLSLGVIGILFVGLSGSLAALSNMLFPSETLAEGLAKDLSVTSHTLLRLRLSHPILSIVTGVYVMFVAGWLKGQAIGDERTAWWSNVLQMLIVIQIVFGAATLLTLGPIVMQLGHLFLADAVWIAFVLMTAAYYSEFRKSDSVPE